MVWMLLAVAFAAGLIAWPFLHNAREQRRLRTLQVRPIEPARWAMLRAALPVLDRLSPELRALYELRLKEFLAYKRYYGCDGLEVSEDMRWLIAAQACLLVLRPESGTFPSLRSVLVYPSVFEVPPMPAPVEFGEFELVDDEADERIGESHDSGRVILSWADVEAALDGDPVNVVVHEFAHQLDASDAGAPQLSDYTRWSAVMQAEYDRLHERASPVLDDYGLEGPGEFFAVASEAYFQQGAAFKRCHASLYELLRGFYRIDTA
ncbi:MAG: M90 family metallopeptidase [Pseudomonadota bacterium]|nr:M90 family metallopeptidase [Pseudomonadota bacterium]